MKERYKVFYTTGFARLKDMTDVEVEYAKKSTLIVKIQKIIYNDGNVEYKDIFVR